MTDTLPKAPGLIFCRSKPKPSLLTSVYNKWYSEIHVPDVLASGAIAKAARYRCRDDGYPIPYLAVYDVPDLTRLQSREFAAIPMTSDLLPNPQRPCHAYVDLDTRFYAYVDEYVVGEVKDEFPNLILSVGMTPAAGTEDDFTRWYRDEHFQQMALEPGWLRTRRYKLVRHLGSRELESDPPTFLALHEFGEGNGLGTKVKPLDPVTDWTRAIIQTSRKIDAAIYGKL